MIWADNSFRLWSVFEFKLGWFEIFWWTFESWSNSSSFSVSLFIVKKRATKMLFMGCFAFIILFKMRFMYLINKPVHIVQGTRMLKVKGERILGERKLNQWGGFQVSVHCLRLFALNSHLGKPYWNTLAALSQKQKGYLNETATRWRCIWDAVSTKRYDIIDIASYLGHQLTILETKLTRMQNWN